MSWESNLDDLQRNKAERDEASVLLNLWQLHYKIYLFIDREGESIDMGINFFTIGFDLAAGKKNAGLIHHNYHDC